MPPAVEWYRVLRTTEVTLTRRYTHRDFVELALASFPALKEDFEEYRDLLHVQMGAFARLVEHAQAAEDWETYDRAVQLADTLWQRPNPALDNALHVSFLEHLRFAGATGAKAWARLPATLQREWTRMQNYEADLEARARQLLSRPPQN